MITLMITLFINSFIIGILGITMLIPCILDYMVYSIANAEAFLSAAILTLSVAILFYCFSFNLDHTAFSVKHGFIVTTSTWIIVSVFASLPLYLSDLNISYTDALFESVSGITTTGSTVLSNLNQVSYGILLWRGLLQWLGGIGIIVIAVAVLPILNIGGMQIFRMESSDRLDKIFPKTKEICINITIIYVVISVVGMLLLVLAGMDLFNAIIHIMTTISTGGFSTSDASISQFDNILIESIIIIFMIIGSLPFTLIVVSLNQDFNKLLFDEQVQLFLTLILFFSILIVSYLVIVHGINVFFALRYAVFNLVSISSGTGYVNFDYESWGLFPSTVIFVATFIGGCTGSASCGLKVFRISIIFKSIKNYIYQSINSLHFCPVHYNSQIVGIDVLVSVFSFTFIYLTTFFIFALLVMLMGADFVTATSAVATALSNVGPGLGSLVGPVANFAEVSNSIKWILVLAMLLGRLEFTTFIILFTKEFWIR